VRLIRGWNCLLAAAGVWLGAYMTWLTPVWAEPLIASLAAFLVCGAGNAVNDIIDRDIDRVNHPGRVLVTGSLSVRWAWTAAAGQAAVALAAAVVLNTELLLLVIGALVLVLAYNLRLKQIPLLGNLVVALLAGFTFVAGGLAVDPGMLFYLPGPLVPAVFAVMFHLVRELVKDALDLDGDRLHGLRTLPGQIGVSATILLALVVFAALAVLTYVPVVRHWFSGAYTIITVYLIDLPLLLLLILVWGNPSRPMLRLGSAALKLGMVLGLVALMVGTK
jgi:geranylgeranylglycerol-phosphate geranylgeranyltransferase